MRDFPLVNLIGRLGLEQLKPLIGSLVSLDHGTAPDLSCQKRLQKRPAGLSVYTGLRLMRPTVRLCLLL